MSRETSVFLLNALSLPHSSCLRDRRLLFPNSHPFVAPFLLRKDTVTTFFTKHGRSLQFLTESRIMPSLLIIPALLSVAIAQTTTISVPFFGFDNFTVQASVVSVKPSATVLALACPSNADECGLFPQQILTYGPSTYVMDMSVSCEGPILSLQC